MKNTLLLIFTLITVSLSAQKKPLSYYLPENITYDKNIPTPEAFFGFQIGEQHVSHDQLVSYMRELDRLSDRITSKVLGRTHENRLVMALTITSPENQSNIDKIREDHVRLTDPSVSGSLDARRAVVVLLLPGCSRRRAGLTVAWLSPVRSCRYEMQDAALRKWRVSRRSQLLSQELLHLQRGIAGRGPTAFVSRPDIRRGRG